jgi:dTDP-4-amino-4,6-dideoxygalactose transaminase
MPYDCERIMAIARKYDIPVIEDAAEGFGSKFKGQMLGTFGKFGVLSFNGNKMITTSGGGALVTPTMETKQRVMFYATQARENAPHYQHEVIGYNYRMSNICAGIGRGQMYVLDEHIARRREIHALYTELLKDVEGITVMQRPSEEYNSNFWLTCILVNPEKAGFTREDLRLKMDEEQIETRPLWKPMHLQPVFANVPMYVNGVSEALFNDGLCLPSGPMCTDEDIQRVAKVITSYK